MDKKELYIAPEAEILCFRPVESLASFLTGTWDGWQDGNGKPGGNGTIESPTTGEGETEDMEP